MNRATSLLRRFVPLLLIIPLSCTLPFRTRPIKEPPPPGVSANRIPYADTDAFDQVFESALTNQDPVILIQTDHDRPEWGDRLNAWIAAWNTGGKVVDAGVNPIFRGQIPGVVVDSDSIREFRLLVEGLMNRLDGKAHDLLGRWAEERVRAHRVELLRPYNLRFHLDTERHVQLIFFNGSYSQHYSGFMRTIGVSDSDDGAEWSRRFSCSRHQMDQVEDKQSSPQGPVLTTSTHRGVVE